MHSSNLKKYRDILEKKKEELLAATPARTPATEPGSKSGDWIDQSSQENDLHVRLALKQTDSKLLRAIEEAIHRIDQDLRHLHGLRERDCPGTARGCAMDPRLHQL